MESAPPSPRPGLPRYRLTGPAPPAARIRRDGAAVISCGGWSYVHPASYGSLTPPQPGEVLIGLSDEQARALRSAPGVTLMIGSEPVWDLEHWNFARAHASVRRQIARARNKGLIAERLRPETLRDSLRIQRLREQWMGDGRLTASMNGIGAAPKELMGWLEAPALSEACWGVSRGGELMAAAGVWRVGPNRILVNPILRRPDAPNGAVELLIDAVFSESVGWATLGLCLGSERGGAGMDPRTRGLARRISASSAGLEAFRAKLQPSHWERFWVHLTPKSRLLWRLNAPGWRRLESAWALAAFVSCAEGRAAPR